MMLVGEVQHAGTTSECLMFVVTLPEEKAACQLNVIAEFTLRWDVRVLH